MAEGDDHDAEPGGPEPRLLDHRGTAPDSLHPGQEPAREPSGHEPLPLDGEEAELVAAEGVAACRVLGEPLRSEAGRLAEAARAGLVPAELLGVLGQVLLASLQGGRARRLYRAEGERVLTGLLLRTPRGQEIKASLDAVNAALAPLAGERLESLRVSMRTPGHFTLSVNCGRFALTLSVRPEGVAVESLSA